MEVYMLNEVYLQAKNNLIEQLKSIDEQVSLNTRLAITQRFQSKEEELRKKIDSSSNDEKDKLKKLIEEKEAQYNSLSFIKRISNKKNYNKEIFELKKATYALDTEVSNKKNELRNSYDERIKQYMELQSSSSNLLYTKKDELESLIKSIDNNEISLPELGLDKNEIKTLLCDKYNITSEPEISFTMIDASIETDYLKSVQKTMVRKTNTLEKGISNDDDLLIRTTEIFPSNKIISSVSSSSYIAKSSPSIINFDIIADTLSNEQFNKNYNDLDHNDKDQIRAITKKKFDIYHRNFRSTLHFTVNGLVSSHIGNDFSNRPFVIADPLKNHIDDSNLHNLLPEDTFFISDVQLSADAAILMNIDVYNSLITSQTFKETIKGLKLYLFTGDQRKAAEMFVEQLGYSPENISEHGYGNTENSSFAEAMKKNLEIEAKKRNIGLAVHRFSDDYAKDDVVTYGLIKEDEKAFLDYIINNAQIDEQLKNELYINMSNSINEAKISDMDDSIANEPNYKNTVEKFINCIGLNNYGDLVYGFNTMMESKYKNNAIITYNKEPEMENDGQCLV